MKIIIYNERSTDEEGFDTLNDDEGWVDTHHYASEQVSSSLGSIVEAKFMETSESSINDDIKIGSDEDSENVPAMDMDAFIQGGGLEEDDPNRYVEQKMKKENDVGNGENIIKTRTYDLHITYDKYYQVPRLWLVGYDEEMIPLSVDKMMEDFSQDHANKTVTIEAHPHLHSTHMASIHPCRHADIMKRLIDQFAQSGKELIIEEYLIIFLKFLQAVIPTIEYDFTRSITI